MTSLKWWFKCERASQQASLEYITIAIIYTIVIDQRTSPGWSIREANGIRRHCKVPNRNVFDI